MTPETSCRFISKTTRRLAMQYLQDVGGSTAHGIFLCLKYGDDISACSHGINPLQYESAIDFSRDYLAASLLSKYQGGLKEHEVLRRERALEKFWSCEQRLKKCYAPFQRVLSEQSSVARVLDLAREKIASWLGDLRDAFSIDDCSFGPGSSSSVPRRKAHPSNKFLACDVSAACAPFVEMFFRDCGFPRPVFNVVEHSRIEYVPKNFKIDRIIAVEPDWNIFFQKGIGKAIRRCLKRVGIDLNNGALKHELLARIAASTGALATVDLSSASDSIALWLVRYLLPDDWFFFMNSVRTGSIQLGGSVAHLTKFSSMGNGFTFELESLIFYALAKAVCAIEGHGGTVSTFGDDIILPTKAVPLLAQVFQTCGFVFNEDKSFSTGYFRESCGAHFFKDWNVKPFYLKESINNDSQRYLFCNSIRRLTHRLYYRDVRDTRLLPGYLMCRDTIRSKCYIPDGYGDGGLISYFDECTPKCDRKKKNQPIRRLGHGIEGFRVRALIPKTSGSDVDHVGMYLYKLREHSRRRRSVFHAQVPSFWYELRDLKLRDNEDPEGSCELRGNEVVYSEKVSYRVGRIFVQRWIDPGQA